MGGLSFLFPFLPCVLTQTHSISLLLSFRTSSFLFQNESLVSLFSGELIDGEILGSPLLPSPAQEYSRARHHTSLSTVNLQPLENSVVPVAKVAVNNY